MEAPPAKKPAAAASSGHFPAVNLQTISFCYTVPGIMTTDLPKAVTDAFRDDFPAIQATFEVPTPEGFHFVVPLKSQTVEVEANCPRWTAELPIKKISS